MTEDKASRPGTPYKLSSEAQIFDYKLGNIVGEGAFSKVRLGFHVETGKRVAIKIIDKKLTASKVAKSILRKEKYFNAEFEKRRGSSCSDTPTLSSPEPTSPLDIPIISPISTPIKEQPASTAELLFSEVKLLMRLNHPNIVKLHQVIDTDLECFIIMEYAAGGELIDYIAAQDRLTESEARRLFRQLISAMHHCHAANVVHRDLKLENLLLNEQNDLLLSDFGLGRTFYQPNDLMYTFCGTPSYAAIELIRFQPYQGTCVDIWSMGIILFVMCSGKMPFYGSTISSLYAKILGLQYKCPDHFSPELKTLLSKIFVADPAERLTMSELMEDAWVVQDSEGPLHVCPPLYATLVEQGLERIESIRRDARCTVLTFARATPRSRRGSPAALPSAAPTDPKPAALPPLRVLRATQTTWMCRHAGVSADALRRCLVDALRRLCAAPCGHFHAVPHTHVFLAHVPAGEEKGSDGAVGPEAGVTAELEMCRLFLHRALAIKVKFLAGEPEQFPRIFESLTHLLDAS